jgi:hypothetical protein
LVHKTVLDGPIGRRRRAAASAHPVTLPGSGEFPLPNKGYYGVLEDPDSDSKDTKPKGFAP